MTISKSTPLGASFLYSSPYREEAVSWVNCWEVESRLQHTVFWIYERESITFLSPIFYELPSFLSWTPTIWICGSEPLTRLTTIFLEICSISAVAALVEFAAFWILPGPRMIHANGDDFHTGVCSLFVLNNTMTKRIRVRAASPTGKANHGHSTLRQVA